ncbi:hypothetical protein HAZT_HAZT000493 [Hyalella azteca]|uniref:Neurotransmitter-gated ion-channel transmembrane domain-containing protein n=1 Tax=Hyalella azteca TaxID=294128 RepID=A0A6A0GTM5_HYAAZ|nr:hypothetical protein HAZT_HAZT000493 [Hyalella azteca]
MNDTATLCRADERQKLLGRAQVFIASDGSYSCLRVDLIFKREFSYYLIQYYIPCCMLVMVSWVSFWLDQHAVPARVSLGVTTLLTMSTQNAGINQSLPPVSYTKAIDVWTGACLTFVFGALLEFALVNYASRSDFQRDQQLMRQRWETDSQLTLFDMQMQQQQLQQQRARYMAGCTGNGDARYAAAFHTVAAYPQAIPPFPGNPGFSPGDTTLFPTLVPPLINGPGSTLPPDAISSNGGSLNRGSFSRRSQLDPVAFLAGGCGMSACMARFCNRSKRIDVIARITFPVAFTVFNIAYWTCYLKEAQL